MTQTTPTPAEAAGAKRFQAAGAPPVAMPSAPTQPVQGTSSGTTTVGVVKTVSEGAASALDSVSALEARITELEAVVHRLASAADGTHSGISVWLEKVGARIKGLL